MPDDVTRMQREAGLMVNREMAEMWFEFFKLNDDYKLYCDQRREGYWPDQISIPKGQTAASMDKLYCDWGDIHRYGDFHDWYDEQVGWADESYFAGQVPLKRGWYLFGSEKNNPEEMPFRQLDDCEVSSNPDKRYIEVDVSVSDVVLRKQFELWLEMVKMERENSNLDNSRNITRYQARTSNASSDRLRRVLRVHQLEQEGLSNRQIVEQAMRQQDLGFNRVSIESNMKSVRNMKKAAKTIINGTIRGSFPAA